jgi:threonine dehydratase
VAVEMLEKESGFDVLVVPIGGGGLISGMAIAAQHLAPTTRIVGVQTNAFPSMRQLLGDDADVAKSEQAGMSPITIAEGIAVKTPGRLTSCIVQELVDDIVLVSEEAVERAVALLLSIEKTVVEGAGAAALAAILEHPKLFQGKKIGIPLTGGNIDSRMLASVIMRDLIRSGQLVRLHVPISDQPGALAELATTIGQQGANIVEIAHDRLSLALNPKGAMLDVVLELQDLAHGDQLVGVLQKRGWKPFTAPMSALLAKGSAPNPS